MVFVIILVINLWIVEIGRIGARVFVCEVKGWQTIGMWGSRELG